MDIIQYILEVVTILIVYWMIVGISTSLLLLVLTELTYRNFIDSCIGCTITYALSNWFNEFLFVNFVLLVMR